MAPTLTAHLDAADDIVAIRALLQDLERAYHAKHAEAIARLYTADARIADLAPPLMRRGLDPAAVQAWLDGWQGPVRITARDTEVQADGDLAVAYGLELTRVTTGDGEHVAWWSRATFVFARTPEGWRITHQHNSVPFHMDGSFRAAIDLEP